MLTSTGRKQMKLTVCFRGLSLKHWHYHVSRLGTQCTKCGHCLHWTLILATSRDCSEWFPFLSFHCSQSVYLFLIALMWRLLFIVLSLQTGRFSAIRCRGGQTLSCELCEIENELHLLLCCPVSDNGLFWVAWLWKREGRGSRMFCWGASCNIICNFIMKSNKLFDHCNSIFGVL